MSVDSYHGADGLTALMCASKEGHSKVVSLLLARGSQVDLQDSRGWSALMFACQAGHSQVVWLLLEHGANVDLQSLAWESAHSLALSHGDTNIRTMVEEKVRLTLCCGLVNSMCTVQISDSDVGHVVQQVVCGRRTRDVVEATSLLYPVTSQHGIGHVVEVVAAIAHAIDRSGRCVGALPCTVGSHRGGDCRTF